MSTALPDPKGRSDAQLISSVREGRIEAYGTLYERHVAAAYRLARQLTRSSTESDDLVSEAFAKVLDALRAGKGPESAFRAYLLTTLRHVAYDKAREDRRIDLTGDLTDEVIGVGQATHALTVPFTDTAVRELERSLAARAFAKLPERWQAVLWHTEVERQSPAEVAPLLGLTPSGVSALAYRAREGLRQAYLQAHLAETAQQRCRATVSRLGAWTRRALSKRERAQVEAHLDRCERCRALAAELADVNSALRAVVAPLVLGGLVASYLATAGTDPTVGSAGAGDTPDDTGTPRAASPRQFVGVAASGVAMAAAIAIALTASVPAPPLAQQPPQAAREAAPPSTRQPLPEPPTVPPQPGPVTPDRPVPLPTPTRSRPLPTTPDTPAPLSEPVPGPARVVLREQVAELALEADGAPVELPFSVSNEGESPSSPLTLTLELPEGISAVAPGGGGGASGTRAEQGEDGTEDTKDTENTTRDGSGEVTCPAGAGTVTCARGSLAPGESAVFRLRLRATRDPGSGRITGSLRLGARQRAQISVPFTVRTADVAKLDVEKLLGEWPRALSVTVGNGGRVARTAEVEFDRPGLVLSLGSELDCEGGARPHCTTLEPLPPGESVRVLYVPHQHRPLELTVSATVGRARASESVEFAWGYDRVGPGGPVPGDPVLPRPTSSEPASPPRPRPSGTPRPKLGSHPFGGSPTSWSRPTWSEQR